MTERTPTRTNWTGYVLLGTIFLLLTNLGYLNFALRATPEYRYTGANQYAPADKLVYMSMIQQGREGILFMKNLHTTDSQRGLLLSPNWFIIGQTARILGVSNNFSYQLYRIVLTLVFLWFLAVVIQKICATSASALTAYAFVLFSGGLGWLYISKHAIIGSMINGIQKFIFLPSDIYVTEGNTLLNFTQAPLFILSQLLMLLSAYLLVQYKDARSYWWDIVNAALVALLILMHPYDLPILAAVFASWAVWELWRTNSMRPMLKAAIVLAGGTLAMLYNVHIIASEPVIAEWLKQNLVYSPPLRNYLWGYGMLIPLWLLGAVQLWRDKRNNPLWMLLLIWSIVVWILLYLPLDLNRRFTNGFHIPLALIASVGFLRIYSHLGRSIVKKIGAGLLLWGTVLSSLVFFLFVNLYFAPNVYGYGYYYVTAEEQGVIDFLAKESSPGQGLLVSDEKLAFTLTSQLNRPVFRGHDHQTPHLLLKQQQVDWFFADQDTDTALERKRVFLSDARIAYVIVNAHRLITIPRWLDTASFLEKVFDSDKLRVYRVR
ncbi:MAG: hypothetical protein HY422_02580 [Candidatus Komeilibacteria bacterium]|nr:hypothetical protein [Candidatus Komeilibacteria bacterium]